jgi:ABC-type phosphate/phosphonate transport system substrate-binding protein
VAEHPTRERRTDRRRSSALLVLAVVATVVAVAVGWMLLADLYRSSVHVTSEYGESTAQPVGEPLVIGIARTPGGPGQWAVYAAALAKLQRDLNRPIKVRYCLEGSAISDLLAKGEVDVALVSTITYLRLHDSGVAALLAAPLLGGRKGSSAVLVVRADSAYRTLEDLKGARVIHVPSTLVGEGLVAWLEHDRGIVAADFFGSVEATGSHDANLQSVLAGRADAAASNRSDLGAWPDGTFRIIAETPEFGPPPLVVGRAVDATTRAAMERSLSSFRGQESTAGVGGLTGFYVPKDSDYDFPRVLRRLAASAAGPASGAFQ